jgi:type II secretory pathway pseudopilin PulG
MSKRTAVSMIETLIAIAIIGLLMTLLFPAVQSARIRAIELQCKNNLHQIGLAVADFQSAYKRIPGPGVSDAIGGWTIEVLPFLEQNNLADRVISGKPIATAPDFLLRQPRIFRCPVRSGNESLSAGEIEPSSYVLVPIRGRRSYAVYDAPIGVSIPWASGPEMSHNDVTRQFGPHNRGFFMVSNGASVNFVAGGGDAP